LSRALRCSGEKRSRPCRSAFIIVSCVAVIGGYAMTATRRPPQSSYGAWDPAYAETMHRHGVLSRTVGPALVGLMLVELLLAGAFGAVHRRARTRFSGQGFFVDLHGGILTKSPPPPSRKLDPRPGTPPGRAAWQAASTPGFSHPAQSPAFRRPAMRVPITFRTGLATITPRLL
jgi:hypothetical protein